MADKPKKKEFDPSKLSEKQRQSGFAGKDAQGIAQLAVQIKEQNKIAQDKKTDKERNDKLDELIRTTKFGDSEGKKTALALKEQFKASQERLSAATLAGDEKLIRLEEKNQASIADSADDLEKSREAKKASSKRIKLLEGIKSGIGNLASKFKENVGFIAGLAGVALAVFDPEKLQMIIDRTVNAIVDTFNIIKDVFTGDVGKALETFKENWKDISLLIGGLAILNFSKIAGFIGTIKSGFLAVFGSGGALATVGAFFGVGAGTAFGIIIAAAAAIGTIIRAIVKTIEAAKETFGETGSVFETFKTSITEFSAQLFGFLPDLFKKAISYITEKLGFTEFAKTLDEFSFVDTFRSINLSLFNGFVDGVNYIKEKIKEGIAKGPDLFDSIVDTIVDSLEAITERFKGIGEMVKALGQASLAAIKAAPAAAFGGEDPRDVFKKTYNDIIAGGDGSGEAILRQIDMETDSRGEELDTSSMNNKLDGKFLETAAPPITVNQIDQSDKSTKTSTVHGGSRRDKRHGFNNNTSAAYA